MNRYSHSHSLFAALGFTIGLMAATGAIGEANAAGNDSLTSQSTPVAELVPLNKSPPLQIIPSRSVGSPRP